MLGMALWIWEFNAKRIETQGGRSGPEPLFYICMPGKPEEGQYGKYLIEKQDKGVYLESPDWRCGDYSRKTSITQRDCATDGPARKRF
jgi:hypothetical protein